MLKLNQRYQSPRYLDQVLHDYYTANDHNRKNINSANHFLFLNLKSLIDSLGKIIEEFNNTVYKIRGFNI